MKHVLMTDNTGFTLIEVVLSTLILSIAMFGNVMLVQNISMASVNSNYQIVACQLANEKLETIIADNSLQGQQYDYINSNNYPNEALALGNQNGFFSRQVNIAEVADDLVTPQAGSKQKRVEVKVTWGNQAHQQVVLSTLITNYH